MVKSYTYDKKLVKSYSYGNKAKGLKLHRLCLPSALTVCNHLYTVFNIAGKRVQIVQLGEMK